MKPTNPTSDADSHFIERRAVPRFVFNAPVEVTEPTARRYISGRITEIAQHGCFAQAENLLNVDSVARLRIHSSGDAFETWGRVVYVRTRMGMGFHFLDTPPRQMNLLKAWLATLPEVS